MDTFVLPDGEGGYYVETPAPEAQRVGQFVYQPDGTITIQVHVAANNEQASPLWGVDPGPHADIVAAMEAVSGRLGGTCERYQP